MKTTQQLRGLLLAAAACALALGATPMSTAAVDGVDPADPQIWTSIKTDKYDQRAHFRDGVERMAARLDRQIAELRAKRAAMTTDTKDWDFSMKAIDESREALASKIQMLLKADTPDTWSDAKDKIGEEWNRAEAAVDKMNSTVTS